MAAPQHNEPVRIFWTGGWDSTFRIASAAINLGCSIEPFYLIDPERGSVGHELRAMHSIRQRINQKVGRNMFLPTRYCNVDDLPEDDGITAAYGELRQNGYLGIQYEWLARWARTLDISRIELSIHVDDRAYAPIRPYLVRQNDDAGSYVLTAECPGEIARVFGRFAFPVIHMTKRQMADAARAAGFSDVMAMTWFCFQPRGGKPCGACNPCRYAMAEDMGHRIPRLRRITGRWRDFRKRHLSAGLLLRSTRRRVAGLRERVRRWSGGQSSDATPPGR